MQINHFQSRPLQYNKSQQELFQRKMNIATYLLEKNRKLHKKIDLYGYPDYCENVILEPSRFRSKVIYPKYSKHRLSTVAHTIDCVCSKILNHGLTYGLLFSLFKFFG